MSDSSVLCLCLAVRELRDNRRDCDAALSLIPHFRKCGISVATRFGLASPSIGPQRAAGQAPRSSYSSCQPTGIRPHLTQPLWARRRASIIPHLRKCGITEARRGNVRDPALQPL